MPELKVESDWIDAAVTFEVYCADCGEGICHLVTKTGQTTRRSMPYIHVTPCETCMDNARFDARKAGNEAGHKEGYRDGHEAGYNEAKAEEHA